MRETCAFENINERFPTSLYKPLVIYTTRLNNLKLRRFCSYYKNKCFGKEFYKSINN